MSRQLIQDYLREIDKLRKVSGTTTEGVISEAFKDLLKGWSRNKNLQFVAQYQFLSDQKTQIRPDGIANTVEAGRRNLANLEGSVIKDNTLLPGEWYGGQLHFEAPQASSGESKSYVISIPVGSDVHEIEVAQEAVRS